MTNTTISSARRTLAFDAATCVVAGLVCAVGASLLAAPLGLPMALLFWSGAVLFPIALIFAWMAWSPGLGAAHLAIAAIGNFAWSAASVAVVVMLKPTPLGGAFVLAQALVVAGFAALEWRAATSLSAAARRMAAI